MGKWKFCSTNFTVEQIRWNFYLVNLGLEIELGTENFEILNFQGILFHTNSDSDWGNESFVQKNSSHSQFNDTLI
jgi:hypothetical protein